MSELDCSTAAICPPDCAGGAGCSGKVSGLLPYPWTDETRLAWLTAEADDGMPVGHGGDPVLSAAMRLANSYGFFSSPNLTPDAILDIVLLVMKGRKFL